MNLRQLIDNAISQLNIYKTPDIDECKSRLNEILKVSQLGGINYDKIEKMTENNQVLTIDTSWSARGCSNTSSYELPVSIIDAQDPLIAAKAWGWEKRINEAQSKLDDAKANVVWHENQIYLLYNERTNDE